MRREIEVGIRAKLLADPTISGLVSDRIWIKQAKNNATLPYIIIDLNSGGDNKTYGKEIVDLRYAILAISAQTGQSTDMSVAIRDALDEQDATISGDWEIYRLQHLQFVHFIEMVEGKPYYYDGGVYRVRASKES